MIKIRSYRDADCENLVALFVQAVHTINARDYSPAQLEAWAPAPQAKEQWAARFENTKTLVATEDDRLVGFANLTVEGCLDCLFVHRDCQRRGVATALVAAIEAEAAGLPAIQAAVSLTAAPFFSQAGYRLIRENVVVRNGQRLPNMTMLKSLAQVAKQVSLRRFEDDDMDLMRQWLAAEHVACWFEHPQNWLTELNDRKGRYRFITHLIAEVDARPVGFCQYYACADSEDSEDWYVAATSSEKVYSLDYLIGDRVDLRQGYGTQMMALMEQLIAAEGGNLVAVRPADRNTASKALLQACGFDAYNGGYLKTLSR